MCTERVVEAYMQNSFTLLSHKTTQYYFLVPDVTMQLITKTNKLLFIIIIQFV